MLNIPVLRWGKPYESLEVAEVRHFHSGESVAKLARPTAACCNGICAAPIERGTCSARSPMTT